MDMDTSPPPGLVQALRAFVPQDGTWQALPGGRSNQVWRVGGLVVKQFRPEAASPMFPNQAAAEQAALITLEGCGLAPRLRAGGSDWLAYDHVPGRDWRENPGLVARVLGRLHCQPLPLSLPLVPMGQGLRQAALLWAPQGMGLPPCPDLPVDLPAIAPRFIHRDPVPGNIVVQGAEVTLIDWQCPAIGDPAEDLAIFLSPAMQVLYRGAALTGAEVAAFLAAYPDRDVIARYGAMRGVLHWRIAAHCAWRAARGDAGYARVLPIETALLAG